MNAKKQPRLLRQKFVDEYIRTGNATQSAIAAGYSERSAYSQGCRLLKKADVKQAVTERKEKISERIDISIERVVLELYRILTVDPILAINDDGSVKPLTDWPQDLRRALSGFDVEEDNRGVVTKKIRFWSKTSSADMLLKKLGAYTDTNNDGLRTLSAALLATIAAREADKK